MKVEIVPSDVKTIVFETKERVVTALGACSLSRPHTGRVEVKAIDFESLETEPVDFVKNMKHQFDYALGAKIDRLVVYERQAARTLERDGQRVHCARYGFVAFLKDDLPS